MFKVFITIVLFFSIQFSFGQLYQVSGKITDSLNNPIPDVNIWEPTLKEGTLTDNNGKYSIELPEGKRELSISYIRYKSKTISFVLTKDTIINIRFNDIKIEELSKVVISSKRNNENVTKIDPGQIKLDIKKTNQLPEILGETDILKALQLSSGINSSSEAAGGLIVRGGSVDQTLVKVDNATIYNPTHLSGLFSVFNSNLLKSVTIYKGSASSSEGGRLSSLVDISIREGDKTKAKCSGSIGLLSSKLTVETPIVKNKHSIIISGRKIYLNEVVNPTLSPIIKPIGDFFKNTGYSFYDISAKALFTLSPKDKLTATWYMGNDKFQLSDKLNLFFSDLTWGNSLYALNYNHIFNSKTYLKAHANLVDYHYNSSINIQDYNVDITSKLRDKEFGVGIYYLPKNSAKLYAGADYTMHDIIPNDKEVSFTQNQLSFNDNQINKSLEINPFIGAKYKIRKLKFEVGMRGTFYAQNGPYSYIETTSLNQITDTTTYNKGKLFNKDLVVSPRLWACSSIISKALSLKGAASRTYQYMHLATISSIALPADFWIPVTDKLPKEQSDQFSLGITKNLKEDLYKLNFEVYYRLMDNLLEYESGFAGQSELYNVDEGFNIGSGKAYGVEIEGEKAKGKLTGKINFTFSRTYRTFSDINNGKSFPAKYDHPIDISTYWMYKFNDKYSVSTVFIYTSGNNMTLPSSRYMFQGGIINTYTNKNSYRMPSYHRLDLSFTYTAPKKKRIESIWKFSIYNVYNHKNPFFIAIQADGDVQNYNLNVKAKQVNLLPILPSITWSFKF